MMQELKWRLANLENKIKHYAVLFCPLLILLTPYMVNNVLPQGNNTLEKVDRGVMLVLFLLLVAQMLTKLLFRIHFKVIDNVKGDKSYVGKLFKRVFLLLLICAAAGFYLSLGFSFEQDLVNSLPPFFVLLAGIYSLLNRQVMIGDNYLAYDLQVVNLEAIDSYQVEETKQRGQQIKLFSDDEELMRIRTTIFYSNEVEDKLAKKIK